jgi:hypothetical protein
MLGHKSVTPCASSAACSAPSRLGPRRRPEMALLPLRCDGSVDLARLRQLEWEWHTRFLAQVRAKMGG